MSKTLLQLVFRRCSGRQLFFVTAESFLDHKMKESERSAIIMEDDTLASSGHHGRRTPSCSIPFKGFSFDISSEHLLTAKHHLDYCETLPPRMLADHPCEVHRVITE